MINRCLVAALLCASGITLSLTTAELVLRACGVQAGDRPAIRRHVALKKGSSLKPPFQFDPIIGWALRTGKFSIPGDSNGRTMTIENDGSRTTSSSRDRSGLPVLVFLGDSFTFGEGLDDNETLPWKVQASLTSYRVLNYAVGGYGTCQAFLRLQADVSSLHLRGGYVVLGLDAVQEPRNIVDVRQDYWTAISSPLHSSLYPRCVLSSDGVSVVPSRTWPVLMPRTGVLVISRIATNAILEAYALWQEFSNNSRRLTQGLIAAIAQIARSNHATTFVLLQSMDDQAASSYTTYLRATKINVIDGLQVAKDKDLYLADGHPGPELTSRWAMLVESTLNDQTRQKPYAPK